MIVFTVSDFIVHINDVLSRSWNAEELCVEGEVSDFKISQGQWVNFNLKDEKGLVQIFMTAWHLRVPIQEGVKVRVYGLPRIYPKFGKFSLSAERVELVGEGALQKALLALKVKLEQEGLFDEARKRPLPSFPSRIALIASRESAAYGDFIRILNERWGGMQIDLYHVKVQGIDSAEDIVHAIQEANIRHKDYDVLVLTRGGGSLEDLMSFNDELVVRAIYASKIPTLVGIGHERDVSLAELSADMRGSTPTDCARRLVPNKADLLRDLAYKTESMEHLLSLRIKGYHATLSEIMRSPSLWITQQKQELQNKTSLISANMRQLHMALLARYRSQIRLLASLDPKGVLARGYSMLSDAGGRAITSVSALAVGAKIKAVLHDGEANLTINQIHTSQSGSQQKFL